MLEQFNERLVELRTEKGISQKEAAADLGVSQALLSHYEKGIREYSLAFLCRAAEYYDVTTDYILGRTGSRKGLNADALEDREEDAVFNTRSIYRAAIMTHERMNAGSAQAGEFADTLYAVTIYRTLFAAAQMGYIPKRWFSMQPKHAQALALSITEMHLSDFPEKNVNARRYGGPEPKSIEAVIKGVEGIIRKTANTIKPPESSL
ncbi:MAG: helix-turn-helix transcriptional regulator [Ruminococcaceae bacterium]|nr:helix-turn-helix transcriptional regulator [Oscillospiraceae bacterium]